MPALPPAVPAGGAPAVDTAPAVEGNEDHQLAKPICLSSSAQAHLASLQRWHDTQRQHVSGSFQSICHNSCQCGTCRASNQTSNNTTLAELWWWKQRPHLVSACSTCSAASSRQLTCYELPPAVPALGALYSACLVNREAPSGDAQMQALRGPRPCTLFMLCRMSIPVPCRQQEPGALLHLHAFQQQML